MADFDSSLPVRTENNGDVVARLADGTTTSQLLSIDTNGAALVRGVDFDIRDLTHVSDSVKIGDGTDFLAVNADGSLNAVVSATDLDIRDLTHVSDSVKIGDGTDFLAVNADGSINAVVSATNLDIRDLTHVSDSVKVGDGTDFLAVNNDGSINAVVTATNLDIRDLTHAIDSVKVGDGTDFLAIETDGSVNVNIRDEAGAPFTALNPLPVTLAAAATTSINDYAAGSSIAAGATSTHDYVAAAGFQLNQIEASASGKMKIQVQVETASGSNTFVTRFVGFNSTSSPEIHFDIKNQIPVATGARVRVIKTNRDLLPQDLYSTISGYTP